MDKRDLRVKIYEGHREILYNDKMNNPSRKHSDPKCAHTKQVWTHEHIKLETKTHETRNNRARRRDKPTNTAEDSNTPVLASDRSTREKKISKDIKESSNTIKRSNWHL